MAVTGSGQISIQDIANEFGGSVPHALSEYYGKGGTPGSGQLKISDFYGTSNTLTVAVIVVGGGGSGGDFGGGGSGGVAYKTSMTLNGGTNYTLTVGAGGSRPSLATRLDNNGGTRVYNTCSKNGNGGSGSSFNGVSGGGGQGSPSTYTGGDTGSASGGNSNYTNTNSNRGGAGAGNGGNGTYGGGTGVTINLATGHSYTLAGGGSGAGYWNVGGSTPGGNTAGGSGIGGVSAYVAGDRSNGVNPDAGTGDPPSNNSAYIKGGDGVAGTGSGGGCASRAEIIYGDGCHGAYMGTGGSGCVIIGYSGTSAVLSGGSITIANGYVSHKYTSSTTINF
jgi:hypothetical protein